MTPVKAADGDGRQNKTPSRNKRTGGGQQPKRSTPSQMRANQQQKSSSKQQQPDISKQENKTSQSPSTSKSQTNEAMASPDGNKTVCSSLEEFSRKAQELKADISKTLASQSDSQSVDQQTETMSDLRATMVKLSTEANTIDAGEESTASDILPPTATKVELDSSLDEHNQGPSTDKPAINLVLDDPEQNVVQAVENTSEHKVDDETRSGAFESDSKLLSTLNKLTLESDADGLGQKSDISTSDAHLKKMTSKKQKSPASNSGAASRIDNVDATSASSLDNNFELLDAKLDNETKYLALHSSLQRLFADEPQALESVCRKMISLSQKNEQILSSCHDLQQENKKLLLIREKLENLCRELQKSNNSIRIESLDLIKSEQSRAKEQTTKIQSTLSGVIKLFDENQLRNSLLRQENSELQTKLKSLLEHCDNWEKSVDSVLKQRDIENRLLKTELAKANLLKNEEREKFLGEKQELLKLLSMMQEQQHRIEGQEAKLRTDLTNYASKYDECQTVIKSGMSKFRDESKRMLNQLEKQRQDYLVLLNKYEASNKTIVQLLDEKRTWSELMLGANKKITALEKLCRALRAEQEKTKAYKRDAASRHETKSRHSSALTTPAETSSDSVDKDKCTKTDSQLISASGNKKIDEENQGLHVGDANESPANIASGDKELKSTTGGENK